MTNYEFQGSRIPKKHVPALRRPKTNFTLPKANHFFVRLPDDKGVLANSARDEIEP
jgi:hypothetical protein